MHGWRARVAPRITRRPAPGRRAAPSALIALAVALASAGCGSSTRSRVSSTSPPAPLTGTAARAAPSGGTSSSAPASAPSTGGQAPTQIATPTPAAAAGTSIARAASAACSAARSGAPVEGSGQTSRSASAARLASSYLLLTRRLASLTRLHAAGIEGVRLGRLERTLRRLQSLYLRASRGGDAALRRAITRLERFATAAAIVAGARACAPPRTAGRAGAPAPGNAAPTVRARPRRHAPPVGPTGEGQR